MSLESSSSKPESHSPSEEAVLKNIANVYQTNMAALKSGVAIERVPMLSSEERNRIMMAWVNSGEAAAFREFVNEHTNDTVHPYDLKEIAHNLADVEARIPKSQTDPETLH